MKILIFTNQYTLVTGKHKSEKCILNLVYMNGLKIIKIRKKIEVSGALNLYFWRNFLHRFYQIHYIEDYF